VPAPDRTSLAAIVLHVESGELGYAVDAEDIQAALGGKLETDHFIIYYAQTPEIEHDLWLIAEDHELRYAEVVAEIGRLPERQRMALVMREFDGRSHAETARVLQTTVPATKSLIIRARSNLGAAVHAA